MATASIDKLEEAEAILRRVLETQERTLGWDHPDTLRSATDLAIVLKKKATGERDWDAIRQQRREALKEFWGKYAHGGPPYDPKSEDELYEGMP